VASPPQNAGIVDEGYPSEFVSRIPYQGYYFRVLKGQGENAPSGAKDYLVNGKMTGGFALLAWPATYGVSGIMTFLADEDGVVFQKDLGNAPGSWLSPLPASTRILAGRASTCPKIDGSRREPSRWG